MPEARPHARVFGDVTPAPLPAVSYSTIPSRTSSLQTAVDGSRLSGSQFSAWPVRRLHCS